MEISIWKWVFVLLFYHCCSDTIAASGGVHGRENDEAVEAKCDSQEEEILQDGGSKMVEQVKNTTAKHTKILAVSVTCHALITTR